MAQCMFPYYVERDVYFSQEGRVVPVPCGKCPACLKRRLASWSHRLEMEALRWPRQFFITLTYDTDNVPISENGFLTLDARHPTLFFKLLRKYAGRCVYYLCGEYGTRNKRPHYHAIVFGTDSMDEQVIVDQWPHGSVYFGQVESASIRYTVQYYDKGEWRPAHGRDDRYPEFSRMSKHIGRSFLTPSMVRHLLENPSKAFIYDVEGRKISIPRYYKKRLYDYVGTDAMVANHPSLLIHRDDMLAAKEEHHKAVCEIISALPQPEHTEELQDRRRLEIINYRQSKRKTRK